MMAPSPYETAKAIVAQQLRDGARHPDTPWTGMAQDALAAETVENVALRLEREAQSRVQFRLTPRGRLFVAIEDLRDTGAFVDEVISLTGLYNRSLADPREPLNTQAVASALIILDAIKTSTGAQAREALHTLLLNERPALSWAAE